MRMILERARVLDTVSMSILSLARFDARESQQGQSFVEMSFFERVSNPYREVNLCAFPLPPCLSTQIVDEIAMMGISCVFLRFLSFRPTPFFRGVTESIGRVNSRNICSVSLALKATPSGRHAKNVRISALVSVMPSLRAWNSAISSYKIRGVEKRSRCH